MLIAFHSPLLRGEGLGVRLQAQPYRVEHLGKYFNTSGSETGAIRVGDTILAYSSMPKIVGGNSQFHFDNAQMNIMQARISRNGKVARPKPCRWGLNSRRDHTGNLSIDPSSGDLYFTRARLDDPTLRCEIWYARKLKRGWEKAVRLQGDINGHDYTSTHPTVGRLPDGSVILYYASNRTDGIGGMDIWYTLVKNGTAGQSTNIGPMVNSPADEITPYYDQRSGVLYFSSDRAGGRGGHDIYCAVGQRNTWQKAEAVCGCLNSEWNDIYFTVTEHDSVFGIPLTGYLSSNRPNDLDSTACCNDLYQWYLNLDTNLVQNTTPTPDTNSTLITKHSTLTFGFPLFLYFHNDEPDPTSRKPKTETSYADCQQHYASLRGEYLAHQKNAIERKEMEEFFDSCVEGNFRRVETLFDYIEEQLDDGHKVTLTVAGYASPLHRRDYNQTLSERRIASFINMIRAWRAGVLAEAIDSHRLTIRQEPRGAVKHTAESQAADPVYSLQAAYARHIEIISCEVK